MAVRRLYEPLCIAFGTTVSSPTVPTYQLYDLPHKFTPRLYIHTWENITYNPGSALWGNQRSAFA